MGLPSALWQILMVDWYVYMVYSRPSRFPLNQSTPHEPRYSTAIGTAVRMAMRVKYEPGAMHGSSSDDRPTRGLIMSENQYPGGARMRTGHDTSYSAFTQARKLFAEVSCDSCVHSNPHNEASRQAPSGTKTPLIRGAQTARVPTTDWNTCSPSLGL